MNFIFSLFSATRHFEFPKGLTGWAVWLGLGLLVVGILWRSWRFNPIWTMRSTIFFAVLLVATPITALFFGLQLAPGSALPVPETPFELVGPALMLFSALPWVLAAGFLGPLPAALLAGLSGIFLGYFSSHSFFTPLEYASGAALFGVIVRQRYRTASYRIMRRPVVAAALVSVVYPLIYITTTTFLLDLPVEARLDFALSRVWGASVVFAMQALAAATFAEVIALGWPRSWFGVQELEPSPAEKSLESRLLYVMAPLVLALVVLLMAGDWIVAGRAARRLLEQQMKLTADSVAQGIPFVLETGQNLISEMARDERLLTTVDQAALNNVLREHLGEVPFFDQLSLLDNNGNSMGGYPTFDFNSLFPTQEELLGIQLAVQGVSFQSYSLPREAEGSAARLSFIVTVRDEAGIVQRILVGHTSLDTNPFTQPVIKNLSGMHDFGGEGILLDEQNIILYHPDETQVGLVYEGQIGPPETVINEPGLDGIRRMVYTQKVSGRAWSVITIVPSRMAQQTALEIAIPLLGLLLMMTFLSYFVIRLGLRVITSSLQQLAVESGRIASGNLDHALQIEGSDEVGQLGQSFEQMRVSLKARLDEINRLLLVSQGVASALEMEAAVKPILEGALATGASSARVVLASAALPEFEQDTPTRFGLGPSSQSFEGLDEQVLALTEQQDQIVLSNPARARLTNPGGGPMPGSLMAIALRHEGIYYGALWAAFDKPHKIEEEEVRFMNTVAGQAALAAANARLYLTAHLGRKRLEAILASTPGPVLVTDHRDQLLLANPAALNLLSNGEMPLPGTPIKEFVEQEALLDLLQSQQEGTYSGEVEFPDERIYFATASPVLAEDRVMGRVCVLSDITHFKALDALKSEFVATVSHDLRSPLTLMRGYATMLQMVGDLNEQQTGYVEKIVNGVESMSNLVNNLLDLGRIEAGVGLQLEMVPVLDTVSQVAEALKMNAIQKKISLNLDLPQETMPVVEADPALLQQAIHNLVENAIKYTDGGGKVDVRVKIADENILFEIQDNGIGVAPVDVPRLFERFYRAPGRQARKQRGSGLGLAIVRSIAKKHGGRAWLESQLGQGSTFYLEIPLRQPKESEE